MNGLIWEGDIAFLLQGKARVQTAFDFEVPCPFEPPKGPCDHRINLRQELDDELLSRFPKLDRLVQAFLPVPKDPSEPAAFLEQADMLILATLARMSAPTKLPFLPLWSRRPDQIIRLLEATNVQPLVLTNVRPRDKPALDRILEASAFLPRRLVLQGQPGIVLRPEAVRVTGTLARWAKPDLVVLPWEAFGAHLLKRHMLKENP